MASVPGKRVRLIDVAARARVSRSAVSHVLLRHGGSCTRVAPATAQRIRQAAIEMGYRPNPIAQSLKGISSRLIGVLVDSIAHGNEVSFQHLLAIERTAYSRGYRLMAGHVHSAGGGFAEYVSELAMYRVDRLVCLGRHTPEEIQEASAALKTFHGVVFLGGPDVSADVPRARTVHIDRAGGVRQAVHHLHERGRRRIGLMLGRMPPGDPFSTMHQRREGYLQGLAETTQAKPVIWAPPALEKSIAKSALPDPGKMDALLDGLIDGALVPERLDAIIMTSDLWAVRLLKRLRLRNIRVPDQVAVVGFDNLSIGLAVDPELTTIDQQSDLVAERVVDILVGDAGVTSDDAARVLIPTRLVVRQSS